MVVIVIEVLTTYVEIPEKKRRVTDSRPMTSNLKSGGMWGPANRQIPPYPAGDGNGRRPDPNRVHKNCYCAFIPGDYTGQLECACHPRDGSKPSFDHHNTDALVTIARRFRINDVTLSGYDTGEAFIKGATYDIQPHDKIVDEEFAVQLLDEVGMGEFANSYSVSSWWEFGHTPQEGRAHTKFQVTCEASHGPVVYRLLREAGFVPNSVEVDGVRDADQPIVHLWSEGRPNPAYFYR